MTSPAGKKSPQEMRVVPNIPEKSQEVLLEKSQMVPDSDRIQQKQNIRDSFEKKSSSKLHGKLKTQGKNSKPKGKLKTHVSGMYSYVSQDPVKISLL